MNKVKMNEVCSLAAEFVQELKAFPADDYLRIKLMMLSAAQTRGAKAFLKVVYGITERQRPLLIEAKEVQL